MNTIFSRIINGEVPADIFYQDSQVVAFHDTSPKAPMHFLVVSRKVIPSLSSLSESDGPLLGHMVYVAQKLAKQVGSIDGFRIVSNCGKNGGQTVDHIHIHVLGGREMQWPPG